MSTKMRFFGMMLIALAVVGCTKPKDDNNNEVVSTNFVKVATSTPTDITSNSASCGGAAFVDGVITLTELGVCWDTTSNPTPADNKLSTEDCDQPYLCTISNLTPGTSYHVRAFAYDGMKYYYGEDKSFTTESSGSSGNGNVTITVSTNNVTEITATSATCGGEVSVNGDVTVTARGVCWSTTPNPTIDQTHTSDGHGVGSFTSTLSRLSANTTYYVKAYAQSGSDIVYGMEKNFTTNMQPQSPMVTVTLVNVTPTYMELKFEPSNNTAYYCYNVGGALTSTTHQTGVQTKKFSSLQGEYFQPDTEYEFSVVAYDANGTAGEIIHPKFKTNPAPYANYYRVFDNFYQLNYAKLQNYSSGNANLRFKEIQLWSELGYWVRFLTLVYYYETDNVWVPGTYITTGHTNNYGQCECTVFKNGSIYDVYAGSQFTISKSGNMWTYDLYGNDGSITAHFTGVPTY